jgi:hypothetical protein
MIMIVENLLILILVEIQCAIFAIDSLASDALKANSTVLFAIKKWW